jgi:hypothetical protein
LSEFRGIPLIDTDAFLDFINPNLESGADRTHISLPFEVPNMTNPHLAVFHDPVRCDGPTEPMCPDFVLSHEVHQIDRAYKMFLGTEKNPTFMPIIFKSAGGAGTKRAGGRTDWDAFGKV